MGDLDTAFLAELRLTREEDSVWTRAIDTQTSILVNIPQSRLGIDIKCPFSLRGYENWTVQDWRITAASSPVTGTRLVIVQQPGVAHQVTKAAPYYVVQHQIWAALGHPFTLEELEEMPEL